MRQLQEKSMNWRLIIRHFIQVLKLFAFYFLLNLIILKKSTSLIFRTILAHFLTNFFIYNFSINFFNDIYKNKYF